MNTKSKTRIYCVSAGNGEIDRLVRATSRSQAVGHVARRVYKSRVATQDDLVLAVGAGKKVEDATVETETEAEQS